MLEKVPSKPTLPDLVRSTNSLLEPKSYPTRVCCVKSEVALRIMPNCDEDDEATLSEKVKVMSSVLLVSGNN